MVTKIKVEDRCIRFRLFKRIEKGYHYVHEVNKAKVDNKKPKYYRYHTYTNHPLSLTGITDPIHF